MKFLRNELYSAGFKELEELLWTTDKTADTIRY